jgi:hypothetical protein
MGAKILQTVTHATVNDRRAGVVHRCNSGSRAHNKNSRGAMLSAFTEAGRIHAATVSTRTRIPCVLSRQTIE